MSKFHSVRLNRELCMGCTNCIKKCPTEAIRVRDGKARISESRCIDCGECIRACPHHAKSAEMDSISRLHDFRHTIALAAPSLYAQFGAPATREMVLSALHGIGFDDVYEVALGAEIVSRRTNEYLTEALSHNLRPVISSACPAVVRLIQMKYPGLIPNLVPFDAPMEVVANLARQQTMKKTGLTADQIGIFFISPCPAKRTAVVNPIGQKESAVDGVIAISDAYPLILGHLEKQDAGHHSNFKTEIQAGACGVRWGSSGGEAGALHTEKYLAVDGIHNVIAILEEIENERLRDIDFIEANSCTGGCIGGPLTVSNRFSAKSRHRIYIAAAENISAAQQADIEEMMTQADLQPWPEEVVENRAMALDEDIFQALQKYEAMKKIAINLPGLDCGSCGAPDCLALAEDIVRGEATETDCIFKLKEMLQHQKEGQSDV